MFIARSVVRRAASLRLSAVRNVTFSTLSPVRSVTISQHSSYAFANLSRACSTSSSAPAASSLESSNPPSSLADQVSLFVESREVAKVKQAYHMLQTAFREQNAGFVTADNAQLFHMVGMAMEKIVFDPILAAECYATAVHLFMGCPNLTGGSNKMMAVLSQMVPKEEDSIDLAEARFNLGRMMLDQDRYEEAVLLLDAALATQRERKAPEGEIYATRRKLAHALLLQGQLDVAKLVLQEGIGETENVEQKGQLILDIGLVLINAGHFADALQRLTQGVEMMGRTPTAALVYMAQCYAGLREEDRADQLFREAIRRGTEECNGEPFHPAMELIYQRFYRFLKKRLGKKWNDEAKRVKKAVQQCQRGTTPMKMSLDD